MVTAEALTNSLETKNGDARDTPAVMTFQAGRIKGGFLHQDCAPDWAVRGSMAKPLVGH